MKTYEIDWRLARCFIFVAAVNVVVSLLLLRTGSTPKGHAGSTVILQITTLVCVYALLAGAYGISVTRGAERVFSIMLCMMFFVMLNIEGKSQFLGLGLVSTSALGVVCGIVLLIVRAEPNRTSLCIVDLCSFALSRNSILFVAALLVYVLARTSERGLGRAPDIGWSWLLHQASLMSVMVLFLYAACPYIKRHADV
ncbi:hypothetical protein [Sinorhizobium medicae]|uniref:Uncharacterized protein n=1 Tax=Sinorhizobium medicae TaxID=110321 RepID=A0ABX4TGA8_9HYPH|nr:hypothetical protein [Sinorhizobium medicae]PLT98024.1 hypothetical protein BMJ33_24720 [Sinorhizobium medicae]PLU17178.1 hypothetical protein BMJ29_21850 [Sinorhizobium medicae]PLU81503.1 hypothetical protein BMJ19_02200 [Sinorhizobium medicae]